MMKLVLLSVFSLIFVIQQSTAPPATAASGEPEETVEPPTYQGICDELKLLVGKLDKVAKNLIDPRIKPEFESDLNANTKTSNPTGYEASFALFEKRVTQMASEYDAVFKAKDYFPDNESVRNEIRDAIAYYLDYFYEDLERCPGFDKLHKMEEIFPARELQYEDEGAQGGDDQ